MRGKRAGEGEVGVAVSELGRAPPHIKTHFYGSV